MAVSLTKIVHGRVIEIDMLPNQQTVKYPSCEQTYRLGYDDSEWHRLSAWLEELNGRCGRATRNGTTLMSCNCVGSVPSARRWTSGKNPYLDAFKAARAFCTNRAAFICERSAPRKMHNTGGSG